MNISVASPITNHAYWITKAPSPLSPFQDSVAVIPIRKRDTKDEITKIAIFPNTVAPFV